MISSLDLIDVHSHLIPAVDDGPRLLQDTVDCLRTAHENGVRSVVATPHMFLEPYDLVDPDFVRERFAEMHSALARISEDGEYVFLNDLKLHLGAENYACRAFLQALETKAVLTLADSRYLLIEFPTILPLGQIQSVVKRIQQQGLVPVLAHVERYSALRNAEVLQEFLDQGCLTQVNLDSLIRPIWSKVGRFSRALVRADVISLVASDSHGSRFRPPHFQELFSRFGKTLGKERLLRLCATNPAWIVQSKPEVRTDHSTSNSS